MSMNNFLDNSSGSEIKHVIESLIELQYRLESFSGHEPKLLKKLHKENFNIHSEEWDEYRTVLGDDFCAFAVAVEKARAGLFEDELLVESLPSKEFQIVDGQRLAPDFHTEEVEHQRWIGTKPLKGALLSQIPTLCQTISVPRILELGTNTGIGAVYLAYAGGNVTTVEGSKQLWAEAAALAESVRAQSNQRLTVRHVNAYFEDFMLNEERRGAKYDLIFIDGQHAEKATALYAELASKILSHNGVLLFDDIYWSEGMHRAFQNFIERLKFGIAFEVATVGLVVFDHNYSGEIISTSPPLRARVTKRK